MIVSQIESIKIQILYDEKFIGVTVKRHDMIKQYLCKYFSLPEKETAVKINEKICDSNESFNDYLKDDKPLEIHLFNINKLIDDQKELQTIKNSQIFNRPSIIENKSQVACQTIEQFNQFDNINQVDQNERVQNEVCSKILYQNQFSSQIIDKIVTCIHCLQQIDKDMIQTPCQHFFHFECLDQYIQNTLQLSFTILQCLCRCKLSLKIINMLGKQDKCKMYTELFLENQLFQIQKTYSQKIGRCIDNQDCKFWFFLQTNTNSQIHKKISCFQCSNQIDIKQTINSAPNQKISKIFQQVKLVKSDTQSNHIEDKIQDQDQEREEEKEQVQKKVVQQDISNDIETQKVVESNKSSNKHFQIIDDKQVKEEQPDNNLQKQNESVIIQDQEENNLKQKIYNL
ncbi:unnamed protein product [Paramecium primaurelia]|uniref:RING-type domain-containing protein n=1 Tax=Paramecium primaurelia TaxID=5886 RepID=A0A8S1MEY6_PARPR|nr:unnamed protein product [Paramecium primaurelia]